MKNSKKEGKKLNNKGFSLVELIVVIAIMAIITAALAPQFMKYIEKSRKSTDISTAELLKTTVSTALSEEAVYEEVKKAGAVEFKVTEVTGVTKLVAVTPNTVPEKLETELKSLIKKLPTTKYDDDGFTVKIGTDMSVEVTCGAITATS